MGSKSKHQNWQGGYIQHLEEIMNIAIEMYHLLDTKRTLTFTISDCILVLFLHDLEKPWKYSPDTSDNTILSQYPNTKAFIESILAK